jgi:hypothetical protein
MSATIEIIDKQDYLLAVYVGDFGVQDARLTIDRIVASIPGDGLRPVLLDCRKLTGSLSILDRFQVAVYGRKVIGKVLRLALVRPQERAHADRFTETAGRNRGINIRLFSDMDEAAAWLKS